MRAETIVLQAEELGISLAAVGDRIQYSPKEAAPDEFLDVLRQHKQEVLRYLTDQEKRRRELTEIHWRVDEGGYTLCWSNTLNDLVAFHSDNYDASMIPPGFVRYTISELRELFSGAESEPTLRRTHLARKAAARATGGHR